jgi:chemotaxis protein MotB
MSPKKLFILMMLIFFMVGACVSKDQYVELQNDHNATQTRLAAEQKQHADLQEKYRKSLNTNRSLMNTVEDLKFELRQEKTAVAEKEQSIAELDLLKRQTETDLKEQLAEKEAKIEELTRTRRNIEESLKEQIEQRDIKIEEIEGKLKVIFIDKILFSSGSVKVKAKGRIPSKMTKTRTSSSRGIRMMFKSESLCRAGFPATGSYRPPGPRPLSGYCRIKLRLSLKG